MPRAEPGDGRERQRGALRQSYEGAYSGRIGENTSTNSLSSRISAAWVLVGAEEVAGSRLGDEPLISFAALEPHLALDAEAALHRGMVVQRDLGALLGVEVAQHRLGAVAQGGAEHAVRALFRLGIFQISKIRHVASLRA